MTDVVRLGQYYEQLVIDIEGVRTPVVVGQYYGQLFADGTRIVPGQFYNQLIVADTTDFDEDAVALFAAMSEQPTAARKTRYNTLITGLKADDNWDAIHFLHLYAAHNADDALLNIKDPATFTATLEGTAAPAFTEDSDYETDGVDNYIDTNFNCSTDGDQDSIGWAFWSLTNAQSAVRNGQNDGTDSLSMAPRDTNDRIVYTVNQANAAASSTANGSVTSSIGFFYCNRSANNAVQAGKNGVQIGTDTDASATPNNLTLKLGTQTVSTFNATKFAMSLACTTRTEAQWLQIYNRLLDYMQGVGAVA